MTRRALRWEKGLWEVTVFFRFHCCQLTKRESLLLYFFVRLEERCRVLGNCIIVQKTNRSIEQIFLPVISSNSPSKLTKGNVSSTIMMLLGTRFKFIPFKVTCGELFECVGHVSIKVRARHDGSEVDAMSRIPLLQNLSSASSNNRLVF
jgi:hypothetical protein